MNVQGVGSAGPVVGSEASRGQVSGVDPRLLLFRVGKRLFGLPLADVVETMRPLPIEPFPGTPAFVRGLAVVRGAPTPVVDLAALFDGEPAEPRRFVTVRAGERAVALAVGHIAGVREAVAEGGLPPLLRDARADAVASIGLVDTALLLVLEAARLVPDDFWPALDDEAGPP